MFESLSGGLSVDQSSQLFMFFFALFIVGQSLGCTKVSPGLVVVEKLGAVNYAFGVLSVLENQVLFHLWIRKC